MIQKEKRKKSDPRNQKEEQKEYTLLLLYQIKSVCADARIRSMSFLLHSNCNGDGKMER